MTREKLRGKYCIVGVGETEVERGKTYEFWHMPTEAAKKAIEDSGFTKKDIDGVVFPIHNGDWPFETVASIFAQYMGLVPSCTLSLMHGGMAAGSSIWHAVMMIEAGHANNVLIATGDNHISRVSRKGYLSRRIVTAEPEWEWIYGPYTATLFALMAQRHMYEYGTTSEQMAAVAVSERKWAALNPKAQLRDLPITVQDVVKSRMIATPFHRDDVCLTGQGGEAFIVTSAERAKDCRKPGISILGFGESCGHNHISQAPSVTGFDSLVKAGKQVFEMGGVTHQDIDVFYPYDPATIIPIIVSEDLGFCKKGEGGPFVASGRFEPGGELPANTHGGVLAYHHPGVPMGHLLEAVLQLRGECGARQVKGARLALIHTMGGCLSNNCVLLFGRE